MYLDASGMPQRLFREAGEDPDIDAKMRGRDHFPHPPLALLGSRSHHEEEACQSGSAYS
jgi:hypothetical protein